MPKMMDHLMNKTLLLARFVVATGLVLAAGAGCAKSAASVDKLIVSNPTLAALDAQLNVTYKQALQGAPAANILRAEQRKWLVEVRNKCQDTQCLVARYTARNAQLAAKGTTPGRACAIKEGELLSHWQRVKGGDFEEFALTREADTRSFASWLHQRPEMMGTWSLENCVLTIANPDNPKLSFEYKVTGFANQVLQLQDADGGERMSYRQSRR